MFLHMQSTINEMYGKISLQSNNCILSPELSQEWCIGYFSAIVQSPFIIRMKKSGHHMQ